MPPILSMPFMRRLFGSFIQPAFYWLKGDRRFYFYPRYLKNLDRTTQEIRQYQLARLKALVRHAYKTVPYYRLLFDQKKIAPEDIKTADDLKRIPELEKKTVLLRPDELKSTKLYLKRKHFSGGSTGNKVFVYKDARYHSITRAVWMRDLASIGLIPGMKSAWVWGDESVFRPWHKRAAQKIVDWVNRRIVFSPFTYTDDDVEQWLKKFNKWKPEYVYGYAGIIYDIAKVIEKRNLKVWKPRKIVTTSERLEHREYIQKVFGCKVHDQYGCSEVHIVAIEDNKGVMHTSDDFVIVELNERNEVLLTPLESYAMPLLRYKLGDIGLKGSIKEDARHPFHQFTISVGRIYEVLQHKDGHKVSGGLIKQRVEDEELAIGEFQVVQRSLENVELNVVEDKLLTKQAVERTVQILCETLGCDDVVVNYADRYPTEPNGKRIAFKCMIQSESPSALKASPTV
jgi:phenylacetate-CoA ligase